MLVFAVAGFYLLASWISRSRVLDIRHGTGLGLGDTDIFHPIHPIKNLSIQDLGSSLLSGESIPKCCLFSQYNSFSTQRLNVSQHKVKSVRIAIGMERGNVRQVRTDGRQPGPDPYRQTGK